MDFLLECIGFGPEHDLEALVAAARSHGDPVAWRGPHGEHLRLPLGAGLDLRIDREEGSRTWAVYPHFNSEQRMRVAVEDVREIPDSPYDALLSGWANPPLDGEGSPREAEEAWPLSAVVTDARRLPHVLERGRVLALSLAGFALSIEHVGEEPTAPARGAAVRRLACGGFVEPLGGPDEPGGCVDLCLRVRLVRQIRNPITGAPVALVEVDSPGRPLELFLSPWQLEEEGLPAPRPGWCVAGTFLLTGRVAGGLESASSRLGRAFG